MAKGTKKKTTGHPGRQPAGDVRNGPPDPADWMDPVTSIYVAVVAFTCGAAVMIVELAASRVLSPYFGNTLYTWTALIGVIMVALSVGYYAGGRLADLRPQPMVLLHLVSAAALFVFLVPALALKVTPSLAPEDQPVDLLWGPVTAALLLFAIPGCLLGTVTPFAIKLLSVQTGNVRVGTSAGTVSMLSTVGSVVGTFAAGFVLIPSLGIRTIFVMVGGVLAAIAVMGYAGLLSHRLRSLPAATLVFLSSVLLGFVAESSEPPRRDQVVHQTETFYHQIRVERTPGFGGEAITTVYMDQAPEGAQSESGDELVFNYTRYYRLERLFNPSLDRALFLGGGAYTMPEALSDDHPHARVEVVEIDPEVERVARRFFRLDQYRGRVHPFTGDARALLRERPGTYDLIFGDAYRGRQNVPSHMVTREFFQLVRRRLNEHGVYMMNLIGSVRGPHNQFFASVSRTLKEVFPELYVFATAPAFPQLSQNLILVAPVQARGWDQDALLERAGDQVELQRMVRTLLPPDAYDLSESTVLTDDHNPVEYIIARQLAASEER